MFLKLSKNKIVKKESKMKKVILAIMLMMGLLACGKKENAATENKNAAGEEKVLRVGLNAVFAPFEYVENGEIKGFDIDLINEIGKNLGYKIEIIDQSFDGLIPALKAGKIDLIISGMSATEERKKSVDFTDEYFMSTQEKKKKKGNTQINTVEDLNGKRIGVQLGTIQENEAKTIKGAIVVPNESTVNIILDLNAGKVDSIILENIVALEYMKKNPELEIFLERKLDAGMAIAFDKGKHTDLVQKFNEELKKMKESGKYEELLNKYGLNTKK